MLRSLFCLILLCCCMPQAWAADPSPDPDAPASDGTPGELRQLEEHFGLVKEGVGYDRMMRVASRLLQALPDAERARIHAVRLLDDDTVNAFATPSGYIYFFRGLVDELETDDQCAAVMGHEMTHILKKHSHQIGKEFWKYQIGGLLAAILAKEPGLYTAGQVLGENAAMGYSRKAESEADQYGLILLSRASYAPIGMLEFMSRLEYSAANNPLMEEGYFLTHPYPAERRLAISAWMTSHGYAVPVQIQKARAPVTIEEWRETPEADVTHLALTLGGEEVLRFAGTPAEAHDRAERTLIRLQAILEAGSLDYDFALRTTDAGPAIVTQHGWILTLLPADAALAGLPLDEFADATLKRIKRILWQRRMRQRLG